MKYKVLKLDKDGRGNLTCPICQNETHQRTVVLTLNRTREVSPNVNGEKMLINHIGKKNLEHDYYRIFNCPY